MYCCLLAQKLDAALSASQGLQQKLDSLAQQSAQDTAPAKTLDAKVDDLNRLLRDREVALDRWTRRTSCSRTTATSGT